MKNYCLFLVQNGGILGGIEEFYAISRYYHQVINIFCGKSVSLLFYRVFYDELPGAPGNYFSLRRPSRP